MKKDMYVVDWKKPEAETSPTESAEPERERVIYSIERSQLAERFGTISVDDITDPIVAPLLPLIKRNIAFAAIPENFGEGSACYLINLTSLK